MYIVYVEVSSHNNFWWWQLHGFGVMSCQNYEFLAFLTLSSVTLSIISSEIIRKSIYISLWHIRCPFIWYIEKEHQTKLGSKVINTNFSFNFLIIGILQFFSYFVNMLSRYSSLCGTNLVLGLQWAWETQDPMWHWYRLFNV